MDWEKLTFILCSNQSIVGCLSFSSFTHNMLHLIYFSFILKLAAIKISGIVGKNNFLIKTGKLKDKREECLILHIDKGKDIILYIKDQGIKISTFEHLV